MILLTRFDRQQMFLNPDQIVSVEETPDTVITLYNGQHLLVRERAQVILNRIIAYRSRVLRRAFAVPSARRYLRRQRLCHFQRTVPELTVPNDTRGKTLQPLHRQDT